MDTPPGSGAPDPLAAATRDTSLALDRWYESRGIALPVETRAEFSAMALEAVLRNPGRDRHEVIADLLAELDVMLADILGERDDGRAAPPAPQPGMPGWLNRLRRRLH